MVIAVPSGTPPLSDVSWAVPSALAVATSVPSGLNATSRILSRCLPTDAISVPDATSQRSALPSRPPVASRAPVGSKASRKTAFV